MKNWRYAQRPLLALALAGLTYLSSATAAADPLRPWLDGKPTALPLLSKKRVSRDTFRYKFGLTPVASLSEDDTIESAAEAGNLDGNELTLGIPICSCLLVSPPSSDLTRPYTPISSRHQKGSFDLLVKRYPRGAMSQYLSKLKKGDCMMFRQIPKNIKEQHPFGKPRTIIMLAAGTGITPMYQALQRLFGADEDDYVYSNVILIYGSRTKRDIYLREEMNDMQRRYPDHFKVIHALSNDKPKAKGDEIMVDGMIDKGVIALLCQDEIFRTSSEDKRDGGCKVWVCGPPGFYNDLCGPREDDGELPIGCDLRELGFNAKDVVKF